MQRLPGGALMAHGPAMPAIYRLDANAAQIAARFAAQGGQDPWAGGHIAPGAFAPVITAGREFVAGPRPDGDPPRRVVPRQWGVPPPGTAGEAGGRGVLTVRNTQSPFWIGNLRNSEFRCLIPASVCRLRVRCPNSSARKHGAPSVGAS